MRKLNIETKALLTRALADRVLADCEEAVTAINRSLLDVDNASLRKFSKAAVERACLSVGVLHAHVVNNAAFLPIPNELARERGHIDAEAIKANPWDLFNHHPEFAAATSALNAAMEHAATLATFEAAWAYMASVKTRWSHVGANDSEPRNLIVDRLNEIFGTTHGYWDDVILGGDAGDDADAEQPLS